ncbi:MAG: hypothetical protein A2431_00990 [Candidatus Zambryskibacteria bacterium RIFOXYC1_FULL_39_10]|uniref:DUF2283 domain-containing protein n=1 Tax=Candidatus Zambryskibacteria bacterium RIFOXYC1_FULL_39_10 TaxID=1802779 RepID=A0A1G2V2G6_9BACT|nr:MAG: hypothetical protein A2431_00990 [Candidatus Zambryskibacteria bacterium RIFOXYC1_FULL_39_10]OHB16875.1 MAG: hypothetical protein A2605_00200 [Candidatus Zambryskibacteria bacterium RIFOXYD1_FULL_39_35]
MKIDYDKTADAVYIRIKTGVVKKTAKLSNLINADLDKNGKVLGVEILKASLKFSKKEKLQSVMNIPMCVSV